VPSYKYRDVDYLLSIIFIVSRSAIEQLSIINFESNSNNLFDSYRPRVQMLEHKWTGYSHCSNNLQTGCYQLGIISDERFVESTVR
jgi:1,4-alpha-glucan branching enzyme